MRLQSILILYILLRNLFRRLRLFQAMLVEGKLFRVQFQATVLDSRPSLYISWTNYTGGADSRQKTFSQTVLSLTPAAVAGTIVL